MPRQYVAVRDAMVAKGKPYDKAQSIAAAVYHKLTGRAVNADAKTAHGHSRGGKSAKKRLEME
jgi:hypothetical protein